MLHVTLHAGRPSDWPSKTIEWQGQQIDTVAIGSERLRTSLPVSFDDLYAALEALPRLFAEPDGSFLWTSTDGPRQWQIDGQLHDSAGNLMTIELKVSGEPPREGLREALDAIFAHVSAADALIFELVRPGVYVAYEQLVSLLPSGSDSA